MTQLTGEPKSLRECEAGALVRLVHRADSRFAFAVALRNGNPPDRIVPLDIVDGFPLIAVGGAELVISYGRHYRIRESMETPALAPLGRSTPGHIEWRTSGDLKAAHLVAKTNRFTALVDIDTGYVSEHLPVSGFSISHRSVFLIPDDGTDAVEVFSTP